MTTAHRATWKAARGGLQEEGSFRLHAPSAAISSKDAPTERELKRRFQPENDISRDTLRSRIEETEQLPSSTDNQLVIHKRPRRSRFSTPNDPSPANNNGDTVTDDDGDNDITEHTSDIEKSIVQNKEKEKINNNQNEDSIDNDSEDDDSEDDDDDSEDEAELLAELEKIKKEREFERVEKLEQERAEKEKEELARVANANPLLRNLNSFHDEISDTASLATGSVAAFAVRRRWDDDVIFKNQAKGEKKINQRFVNDTIRNDYHRNFMKQFMK